MDHEIISFTKMHGLGNDFVLINALHPSFTDKPLPICQLADRRLGIGFDQLLIIEPSHRADFFCRIYNADGSEAEQCGNGLRCVARFIYEEGLHKHKSFRIETKAGIYPVVINDYDHICVLMGAPTIDNPLIDLHLPHSSLTLPASVLSVGNPHIIIRVESIDNIPVKPFATEISALFPQGANVGFMQIINAHHVRLRTHERGAGETGACGSNACAAAVTGITNGWLGQPVRVEFRYGSLKIEWEGAGNPIKMTGSATRVFSGEVDLDNKKV